MESELPYLICTMFLLRVGVGVREKWRDNHPWVLKLPAGFFSYPGDCVCPGGACGGHWFPCVWWCTPGFRVCLSVVDWWHGLYFYSACGWLAEWETDVGYRCFCHWSPLEGPSVHLEQSCWRRRAGSLGLPVCWVVVSQEWVSRLVGLVGLGGLVVPEDETAGQSQVSGAGQWGDGRSGGPVTWRKSFKHPSLSFINYLLLLLIEYCYAHYLVPVECLLCTFAAGILWIFPVGDNKVYSVQIQFNNLIELLTIVQLNCACKRTECGKNFFSVLPSMFIYVDVIFPNLYIWHFPVSHLKVTWKMDRKSGMSLSLLSVTRPFYLAALPPLSDCS